MAGGSFGKTWGKSQIEISILLFEILAFMIPTAFMILFIRGKDAIKIPVSIKQIKPKNIRFSIYLGIITCLLSFLLNILFLHFGSQDVSGINPAAIQGRDIQQNFLVYLVSIVIVPAIVEEIYIHGVLFGVFSRYAGTKIGMIISSLVFAMLHASFYNFVGPFIAGLLFSWLTYIFKSIWPSVIAHATNNLGYLIMLWITDTYSAFGIWKYIYFVCFFLLLLFAYFALICTEKLLLSGRVPKFKLPNRPSKQAVCILTLNPGAIIFIISFLAKTVFKII